MHTLRARIGPRHDIDRDRVGSYLRAPAGAVKFLPTRPNRPTQILIRRAGNLDVEHLVDLARRALDRVTADESEWRDLWQEADALEAATAALGPVRDALTPSR